MIGHRTLAILLLMSLASCVDTLQEPQQATFGVTDPALTTAEYGPAKWVTSPNFMPLSRKPGDVSVIVIHTTQGTYTSAIDWFQNSTGTQAVSAHYVISKTGDITQMVLEKDKAWHVGSANGYTIGLEHEGMIDDPAWATEPMLDASAKLCCYLLKKWQLTATKDHVKGHVELPGQTHVDPGQYWPWDKYLTKVQACMTTVTPDCGSCDDKNACTKDECVAGACMHTPQVGACDDGDACTVGDYCAQGLCLSGATTGCGDTTSAGDGSGLRAPPDAGSDVGADLPGDESGKRQPPQDVGPELLVEDIAGVNLVPSAPQSASSGCQATPTSSMPPLAALLGILIGCWCLVRRRA